MVGPPDDRREGPAGGPTAELRTLQPGTVHGQRYRVETLLGRGGMGEVWKAFDLKLQVEVALKSLHPDFLADERHGELLRREVRAARDVASPHVCRIFDLVELDGQELVSMEFIDGSSLGEILVSRGPLEVREAAEIAAQLLAGLDAIHGAGLVHRDLKPDNIMITRAGRVVVMDFGIARALPTADAATALEGVTIAGTPAYMSPEQMRGDELDARSDVYASGIVLAEMLVVSAETSAEQRKELWRGVRETPPKLPEGPWQSVLKRAIAPEPMDRFASATEFARAIEEASSRAAGDEERTPYPGLSAFTESDKDVFFGREFEVESIWKMLDRFSMLAVIGPSGVGKSSFLRAGVLPAAPAGWRTVICSPGRSPFTALAQSLVPEFSGETEAIRELVHLSDVDEAVHLLRQWRGRHEHVLLVLDQFEELFTLNPPEVQAQFAELLGRLPVDADVHVLVSMRDDFFFHCQKFDSLAPLFKGTAPLGPLSGGDLRRALVQPALSSGYRFEDEALVEEMLSEVSDERGALPLLAFAAARLWEKRDRTQGLLTRKAYEETGRVAGALARHAEATLERIGSEHLDMVREMFRNLVTAEGTRVARTRKEILSVFEDEKSAEAVLQQLIDARLLTSYEEHADVQRLEEKVGSVAGAHRIEIVHESLLRSWPRLVRWRTQDEDSAQLRDQLRQAAQLWEEKSRSDDLLWTGTAYREFQIWRERYPGGLTETEEGFARAMGARERRQRRTRRVAISAAFAILTAVLIVVGISRQQAVAEARRAEAAKLFSLGQLEIDDNTSAALAYATASLELADTPEVRRFALECLWRGPTALLVREQFHGADLVGFSSDHRRLAFEYKDERRVIFSIDGGEPVIEEPPQDELAQAFQFGTRRGDVVLAEVDNRALMFSASTGEKLSEVPLERMMFDVRLSRGGDRLTVMSRDAPITNPQFLFNVWDSLHTPTPRLVSRWEGEDFGGIGYQSLDSSSTWLAYALGNDVMLIPAEGPESAAPRRIGSHENQVVGVRIQPDDQRLASMDVDGEIRFWPWEPPSERPLRTYRHKATECWNLNFDESGSRFGVAFQDGTGEVWDLAAPTEADPIVLRAGSGTMMGIDFDTSRGWAHTNYPFTLWNMRHSYPWALRGHKERIWGLVFARDGSSLASTSDDGTVRIWPLDPDAGKSRVTYRGDTIKSMVGDDRGTIVVLSDIMGVKVHNLETGAIRDLSGFTYWAGAAISPEGSKVAARGVMDIGVEDADSKRILRVWDLQTDSVQVFHCDEGTAFVDLEFTSETSLLVTMGNQELRRYDLETGEYQVIREQGVLWMDLTEDDRFLLSVGSPGFTLHDLETGDSKVLPFWWRGVAGFAISPDGDFVAVGDGSGAIHVGRIDENRFHMLLGHEGGLSVLEISPDGKWIASGGRDGTVRIWSVPDFDRPPLHTLPRDVLLEKLKSLTNLVAVPDTSRATGWKIDIGPFPGWAEAPTW